MKITLFFFLIVISLNGFAKDLMDPELTFTLLSNAFPTLMERSSGPGTRIMADELVCSFSHSHVGKKASVLTSCEVTKDQKNIKAKGKVSDLIFALINAGALLDNESVPGTTYVKLENLECTKVNGTTPSYSCKAGKELKLKLK